MELENFVVMSCGHSGGPFERHGKTVDDELGALNMTAMTAGSGTGWTNNGRRVWTIHDPTALCNLFALTFSCLL